MKDYLKKLIANRRSQVETLEKAMIDCDSKEERAELGASLKTLRDELNEAEAQLAKLEEDEMNDTQAEEMQAQEEASARAKQMVGTYSMRSADTADLEARNKKLEADGKALMEKRAIKVETGAALLPKHTGNVLNDTFTPVSTLVDRVATEELVGGESYAEAYVKSYATGGITAEGQAYATAEPVFGYAPMNKIKITAYAELTEEIKKLSPIAYAEKVSEACLIALKKKLSQQIIAGTGTNQMVGITASPIAIDSTKDAEITALDANTVNEAVFSFGGDEDVEEGAVLILNKKTLKALSEVKKGNGDPFYTVDTANRTINTIPYIINSNVKDFASAGNGDFVALYGNLNAYKVAQFSPVEIVESNDYKFKEGMICFKASCFVAGNVVMQDGFLRLKKKVG